MKLNIAGLCHVVSHYFKIDDPVKEKKKNNHFGTTEEGVESNHF